jgi:hypothetical protein
VSKKKKYQVGKKVLLPVAEILSPRISELGFVNNFYIKVSHNHNTRIIFFLTKETTEQAVARAQLYLDVMFGSSAKEIIVNRNVFTNMHSGEHMEIEVCITRRKIRKHQKLFILRVNDEELIKKAETVSNTVVKYAL